MKQSKLDTIYITDLIVPCIIGVFDAERTEKQQVIITIALSLDTKKAGTTDDINDTVSYHDISLKIVHMVENAKFFLLEKLAQAIADICLSDKRVKQVIVRVDKPKALKLAKSSAIEITRNNE